MNLESISSRNLSKEIAYLFGVYLTDGSIIHSTEWPSTCHFTLKTIDNDFAEFTLSCIKKIKSDCSAKVFIQEARDRNWGHRVSKCQRQYCVGAGFTEFSSFFEQQTGKKHHIPYLIWDASDQIKKWFIAGVMDGDGWISKTERKDFKDHWTGGYGRYQYRIGIGGIAEGWIHEFENLLHKIGVRTLKKEIVFKSGVETRNIPLVNFGININSFVEHGLFFTINRKQERVKLLRKVQRLNAIGPTGSRNSPIFAETRS